MTDQDIISSFNKLQHSHNKYNWYLNHNTQEIKSYIYNRYIDSVSDKESLFRILFDIEHVPLCPICNNKVKFIGRPNRIYNKYCSNKCKYKDINMSLRHKQGCLNKYGIENISMLESTKQKKEQTFLKHFGTKNNYGRPSVVENIFRTRKNNHSLNTSKPEEELHLYIKDKFPNVKRQYKDKARYPWHCDFYIPDLDCFIEYNGFQGHGKHAYNPNSIEDQLQIQKWKSRYNNGEHPLYKRMIESWTIYDVKKREIAKKNNLNFHEFWNLDDAKRFIDSLNSGRQKSLGDAGGHEIA